MALHRNWQLQCFFFLLVSLLRYPSTTSAQRLLVWNDARLTQSGSLWLNSGTHPRSSGRALYSRQVPVCSGTGFNTSFVFSIQNTTADAPRGEGLAFLVSGYLSPPPANSSGPYLGLLDPSSDRDQDNRMVAVEFDTVYNSDLLDINNNHVGVDANQIQSLVTPTLQNDAANRVDLHDSGSNVSVWVEFDEVNGSLTVSLTKNSLRRPAAPLIDRQPLDLCREAAVNGAVFVGFSASTGDRSRDVHVIHAWSFSSGDLRFGLEVPVGGGGGGGGGGRVLPVNPEKKRGHRASAAVVIVIVISSISALLFCGGGIFLLWTKRSLLFSTTDGSSEIILRGKLEQPSEISYHDLKSATSGFNPRNILGSGGFGNVYVGQLDGSPVAVKRISDSSQQGQREFVAEVEIISKLSHRNLVPLRGWCCRSKELLLVYELMPNGSLDKALSSGASASPLDWKKRYEIVSGLASALLYLHEECDERIVHRDVKPSNVMLDADYNPRLGDFGLARLIDRRREARTTAVAGTFGYLAPELNVTGQCTTLSDVYSFGIVVLEVVSGKKPFFDEATILGEWIWQLYCRKCLVEAADPRLEGRFDQAEVELLLTIGLACSNPNPKSRPTMRRVVHLLGGEESPAELPQRRHEDLEFGWFGPAEVMARASLRSFPDYMFSSSSEVRA